MKDLDRYSSSLLNCHSMKKFKEEKAENKLFKSYGVSAKMNAFK
jgi:hypothetical protein